MRVAFLHSSPSGENAWHAIVFQLTVNLSDLAPLSEGNLSLLRNQFQQVDAQIVIHYLELKQLFLCFFSGYMYMNYKKAAH